MIQFKKYWLDKTAIILLVGILSLLSTSCMRSNAASTDAGNKDIVMVRKPIADNTLKIVNAAFYQTFVLGDWRYKGARDLGGTINAYIQIPAPLDMSKAVQKSYLQKAICPSAAHVKMWKEVSNIPLSIHIYTQKQKNSTFVSCANPYTTS